jgi:hypothetical protein
LEFKVETERRVAANKRRLTMTNDLSHRPGRGGITINDRGDQGMMPKGRQTIRKGGSLIGGARRIKLWEFDSKPNTTIARMAWAIMVRGERYKEPKVMLPT